MTLTNLSTKFGVIPEVPVDYDPESDTAVCTWSNHEVYWCSGIWPQNNNKEIACVGIAEFLEVVHEINRAINQRIEEVREEQKRG